MLTPKVMVCTDTEGSFMIERVVEIADACIRHLNKLANHNGTAAQKDAVYLNPHSAMCHAEVSRSFYTDPLN